MARGHARRIDWVSVSRQLPCTAATSTRRGRLTGSSRNTPGSAQLVTLNFPTPLQQRVINALKADPKTVDLRAQAPHFYALGARIMELFEDPVVLDTLLDVSDLPQSGWSAAV